MCIVRICFIINNSLFCTLLLIKSAFVCNMPREAFIFLGISRKQEIIKENVLNCVRIFSQEIHKEQSYLVTEMGTEKKYLFSLFGLFVATIFVDTYAHILRIGYQLLHIVNFYTQRCVASALYKQLHKQAGCWYFVPPCECVKRLFTQLPTAQQTSHRQLLC